MVADKNRSKPKGTIAKTIAFRNFSSYQTWKPFTKYYFFFEFFVLTIETFKCVSIEYLKNERFFSFEHNPA